MNSSRLVGAFCLLFSLLFVLAADEAAAQVIDISQPVVVDPSVLRYPAEKRGIIDYYSFNQACRGESYILLVVGNNVSLSYDTGVLSLLRTDLQGNLIDTIPKPLIPNLATPREKNFSLYGVVWSAPYFYLIGQWMENYGVYSDSLSYIRVTEDLEIVDQRPVAMMPRLMQFSLKFDAQDGVIWMGYEHHGLSLYKYDLSSNQVTLNGLEPIPSDWVRSWATCQSNGWYLALRTDHNEDSIYNVYG